MTGVRARVWRCRRDDCDHQWENVLPVTLCADPHRNRAGLLCKGPLDPVDPVPTECAGQLSLLGGGG